MLQNDNGKCRVSTQTQKVAGTKVFSSGKLSKEDSICHDAHTHTHSTRYAAFWRTRLWQSALIVMKNKELCDKRREERTANGNTRRQRVASTREITFGVF